MTLLAPLRIEAAALRLGAPKNDVERIGMGPARARASAGRLAGSLSPGAPVAVVGFGGGLDAADRAGDLVVATELFTTDGPEQRIALDSELAEKIAIGLARARLSARTGPVACSPVLQSATATAAVVGGEAVACEMESAWLGQVAEGRPFAVVRVIVDRPGRPLAGPWTLTGGIVAWRHLVLAAGIVAAELEQYR